MSIELGSESRVFVAGASFDVSNQAELDAIEETLIHEVDPLMSPEEAIAWEMHKMSLPLLQTFTVKRENTVTISALRGVVIANAYAEAIRSRAHGWRMESHQSPSKEDVTGNLGKYTVGVMLRGIVPSEGRRHAGRTVEKAVFWVPSLTNFHARRPVIETAGLTVRRYATHPRFVEE